MELQRYCNGKKISYFSGDMETKVTGIVSKGVHEWQRPWTQWCEASHVEQALLDPIRHGGRTRSRHNWPQDVAEQWNKQRLQYLSTSPTLKQCAQLKCNIIYNIRDVPTPIPVLGIWTDTWLSTLLVLIKYVSIPRHQSQVYMCVCKKKKNLQFVLLYSSSSSHTGSEGVWSDSLPQRRVTHRYFWKVPGVWSITPSAHASFPGNRQRDVSLQSPKTSINDFLLSSRS